MDAWTGLSRTLAMDEDPRCWPGVGLESAQPGVRGPSPDADHSKWVPPAHIARVIRFLCSPDSAATSGAAIPVYGRAG